MAYYVCKGAKLKCSMGSDQSDLDVIHLDRPVRLEGNNMAGIMDHKPMVNIKPFGQCKSLANPTVAAATAANYGRLQEMPCIPNTTVPWLNGKMTVFVKGQPALLDCSKCMCLWAGVIEITDAGQKTVCEGAQTSSGSGTSSAVQQGTGGGASASSSGAAGMGNSLQGTGGSNLAVQGMAANSVSQGTASGGNLAVQGVATNSTSQGTASSGNLEEQDLGVELKVTEIYWSYMADYIRLADKSRFYTDLNIHVKTENSNDGDTVNVTLKRKDGQPLFGIDITLDLMGTVFDNEAVIENAFEGYSLDFLEEITAECSGTKASIKPRRPKWEDFYNSYPHFNGVDKPVDDVFKYILGNNYDRKMFNNGGAARICIALIETGADIKKDFLVQDGSELKKKLIQKNKENENKRIGFIASAKNLQEWLSSVWGKADVEIKGKTTIEAVQAAINGRNGVYIILGGFESGASGASTLWIGENNDALGGFNYIYKGGTVYFWELKSELDSGDEAWWRYYKIKTFIHTIV